MKPLFYTIILLFSAQFSSAQELFVFTEPASNMPAKSLGFRNMTMIGTGGSNNQTNVHIMPEVMVGFNNKWMAHVQGFLSNVNNKFVAEGFSSYVKYRFLSNDEVHEHFRMAAFARASYNNALVHQDEIETMGHNSGFETGIIATQLLHKTALSTSVSFERAIYNNIDPKDAGQPNSAINYTFSFGQLLLPKVYSNYQQTNVNFMVELLGQRLINSHKSYLDIGPSVQFIFNSVTRLDFGFRTPIYSNMERTSTNLYLIKVEHNLFNVLKRKKK
ncbi:MAG: hypothetical protein KGZ59_08830 [Chitinophagaceae bacterium]|nr:hypothetical protein [Chitinophagaceae bacterium]